MLNDLKHLLKYKISEVKNGQRFFIGEEEYLRLGRNAELSVDFSKMGIEIPGGFGDRVYIKLSSGVLFAIEQDTEVTGDFGVPLKELKIGDYFIDSDGALCHIRGKSYSVCYIDFLGGEDTIYDLTRRVKPVEVTVEDGTIVIKTEP